MKINILNHNQAYLEVEVIKDITIEGKLVPKGGFLTVHVCRTDDLKAHVRTIVETSSGSDHVYGDVSWSSLFFRTDLEIEGIGVASALIAQYSLEDTCPTVTGEFVEPDGHDQYGFPSVPLMFGYA